MRVGQRRRRSNDLVRGDGELDARRSAGRDRPAAGRDQDVPGRDACGPLDSAHGVRPSTTARSSTTLDARAVAGWRGRSPSSRSISLSLCGDQRRPVEARLADGPAEAGGILELVGEAAGVDQELLRHAAADDAGAADPVLLGDRRPWRRSRRRCAPRARRPSPPPMTNRSTSNFDMAALSPEITPEGTATPSCFGMARAAPPQHEGVCGRNQNAVRLRASAPCPPP